MSTNVGVMTDSAQAASNLMVCVLRRDEAMEFRMGASVAKCFVHPGMGARMITLNYSPTSAGYEFPQHIHDESDDTIVSLKGQADLRQGDSRCRFVAGQSVLVPAGEVHGTITMEDGTEMISFQTPPDMALYTGGRDSSRAGAAEVKGLITPGAVKYVDHSFRNGIFMGPASGAERIAVGIRRLEPGEVFSLKVGGEAVAFVWEGELEIAMPDGPQTVAQKDALFAQGRGLVEFRNASSAEVVFVHAVTPPAGE